MTSVTDHYTAFRAPLLEAGVLVDTGVPGLYGKGHDFLRVFDGLTRCITDAGAAQGAEVYRFPPLMPRGDLLRTDYLRSFPNLVGSVHSFLGGEAGHADLLRTLETGGDWGAALGATDVVLVPAACYPLYPMVSGTLPPGGRVFDVLGTCFRHEPSPDPARMQSFHQREYVHIGGAEGAMAFRDDWLDRAQALLDDLGVEAQAEVANDPFFGRAGRLLAVNQRESALKYELTAVVADPEQRTAIVSCNCHRDHLTVPFGITTSDGDVAHSACVGFGMERIVLALFSAHGPSIDGWPPGVRGRLWR